MQFVPVLHNVVLIHIKHSSQYEITMKIGYYSVHRTVIYRSVMEQCVASLLHMCYLKTIHFCVMSCLNLYEFSKYFNVKILNEIRKLI